jgi:SSS family solute:Na+ symporter
MPLSGEAAMVLAVFGPLDWIVVAIYFVAMIAIGLFMARPRQRTEDYFLGGRSLPTWAVSISIVATTLSAATFVGAPEQSYAGNLGYLSSWLGTFLAVIVVCTIFIPKLYRAGTVTIYGYLAKRYGEPARIAVSLMFLAGRMLASGARLFIAAMPLCLLLFAAPGETNFVASRGQLIEAVCVIGLVGTFYTTLGGIRTVVWTDVIQFFIVVGAAALSIAILLHQIHRSPVEIARILGEKGKLRVFDFSFKLDNPFTIWAGVLGNTFLVTASLGVDQDFAQRFLISKSPLKGAMSIVYSQIVGLIVSAGFMVIGLLLYIFYKRPDVMGAAAPTYAPAAQNAYPSFLVSELPTVVSGIAIAGFFAIAQGSMDSAINALASSAIADIYVPLRRHLGYEENEQRGSEAPKVAVLLMGVVMVVFAIVCITLYGGQGKRTLIDFALGVMAFAYSGMLGVFLTALLTRQGNSRSVIAALAAGVLTVALLQPGVIEHWSPYLLGHARHLAGTWWMPIGTAVSFAVCVIGAPDNRLERSGIGVKPARETLESPP